MIENVSRGTVLINGQLEQRLFGRHAHPAREPVGTGASLPKDLEGDWFHQGPLPDETELFEALDGPSPVVAPGRLGDDELSVWAEQGSGALRSGGRRSERSGHHQGSLAPQRASSHPLRPIAEHSDPIGPAQMGHGLSEKGRAQVPPVEEEPPGSWPRRSHYQAGETAAAAQVDDGSRRGGFDGSAQGQAAVNLRFKRTGPEMA